MWFRASTILMPPDSIWVCDPFDFICYEAVSASTNSLISSCMVVSVGLLFPGSFLSRGTRFVAEGSVMSQGHKPWPFGL